MAYKSLSFAGRPMPVDEKPRGNLLLLAVAGLVLVVLAVAVLAFFAFVAFGGASSPATTTTTESTSTTQTTVPAAQTTTTAKQQTTTTTSKPTTTINAKTTTTIKTTTTATTSSTTTTEPPIACSKSSDCGAEKSYLRCKNDDIVTVTETPLCKFTEEGSYCTILQKTQTYEICSSGDTCIDLKCQKVTTTTTLYKPTTSTTIRFLFPTTTTTVTIPDATYCFGRSASGQARGPSDCSGLKCGGTVGGITRSCVYVGEGDSGHCTCQ